MPSVVLAMRATSALLLLLAGVAQAGNLKHCPHVSKGPLSCQNTTEVANTCCFNAPGGLLLQTQFWDSNPETGPEDSWTIHGLWPDNCDGTYGQYCDESRQYTNITQILEAYNRTDLLAYMNEYWQSDDSSNESFWEHEFGKHATCISTLDPSCYDDYQPTEEVPQFFHRTVELFKTLPTYKFLSDAGIVPSSTQNYTSTEVLAALSKGHGYNPTIECYDGQLDEVWYYFNVRGTVQHGEFEAASPSTLGNCPDSFQYLPKVPGSQFSTTSSSSSATATPTTSTPSAKASMDVPMLQTIAK